MNGFSAKDSSALVWVAWSKALLPNYRYIGAKWHRIILWSVDRALRTSNCKEWLHPRPSHLIPMTNTQSNPKDQQSECDCKTWKPNTTKDFFLFCLWIYWFWTARELDLKEAKSTQFYLRLKWDLKDMVAHGCPREKSTLFWTSFSRSSLKFNCTTRTQAYPSFVFENVHFFEESSEF